MPRFRKWFVVAAPIGALALACLPGGDEPVDYLERPDAIIVQMLNVSGQPQPKIADRLTTPEFTLYGDGTLIFTQTGGAGGTQLLEAELPKEAIEDLLAFIVGEGFLNFAYEHAGEGGAIDATTTFLYVNTKAGVNSTSAYALAGTQLENAGDEFEQFRRLQAIKQRLDELDPEALGGTAPGEFVPEAVLLMVQPLEEPNIVGSPAVFPFPEIDLAEIAPPGSGLVERRIESALGTILGVVPPGPTVPLLGPFQQGDRFFFVGFRPVLPFEENFPEFDFP